MPPGPRPLPALPPMPRWRQRHLWGLERQVTQWSNKQEVIEKMNRLVAKALLKPTIRKATLPTPASKEKRLDTKKRTSLNKILRKKINRDE